MTRVKTIGRCLPPESGNICTLFYSHYPMLANNEHVRSFVHAIAGWQAIAPPPLSLRRSRKPCVERAVRE